MDDWRNGSRQNIELLMTRFYDCQAFSDSTDVTFKLPDGSEVNAHKLVLSISSEVFHSQFFGPLADKTVKTVKVSDSIDSNTFRIMIKSIYYSGFVPDLEISEYMELLEAASFYLLHEVIYECNYKLSEHIQSLNIEDLVDWSVKVSQLSIHDQLYGSCREAILAKLSSILKEEKWDCFSSEVRKKLLEDLEYYEVWKGDLLLYLQVLKRLSSLELNSLFPERILKFNSNLEYYFQTSEHYLEFLVDGIKDKLIRRDDYGELENKLKDHLNSIETQGSELSQMYSILKGVGLDLDGEFKWDEDYFTMERIKKLEENGVDWGKEGTKDKEHYWRLLEFANKHQLDNLKDHCDLRLFGVMLESIPTTLAHYINRASHTPGGEELFKLGIHVFVNVSLDGKWCVNPYVDVENWIPRLTSRLVITEDFNKGCITFNEEAIKSISDQLKSKLTKNTLDGALRVCMGINKWCNAHSASPKEAWRKFYKMIGEKVIKQMRNSNKDE